MWSILVKGPCAPENVCFTSGGRIALNVTWSWFLSSALLLMFLLVLFLSEKYSLKSSAVITDLSVSLFISVHFCCVCFSVLLLATRMQICIKMEKKRQHAITNQKKAGAAL